MNWRNEEVPKIDEEKMLKKYIKNELMNYYLYLDRYYKLMEEKYSLYHKSVGGSVIPMPDGSNSANDGIAHKAVMHESEMDMLMNPFREKLDKLDSWMSILTKPQHDVIKIYVMQYQCENARRAANELRYEEDTILKYTARAINRIYTRIKKIL